MGASDPALKVEALALLCLFVLHTWTAELLITNTPHTITPTMATLSESTVVVVQYVLVGVCFLMTTVRICVSWRVHKRWTTEDGWMLLSLFSLTGLWYASHAVHNAGNNNVAHPELLTPAEIKSREAGSKTGLLGRVSYAST